MRMKILVSIIIVGIILITGCDDNSIKSTCNANTIISADLYLSAPNDKLSITSLEIDKDCLQITFTASGCSGNSWEVDLIDSEQIMESLPPQRNLRLSLKNNELCTAVVGKTVTFNISELQLQEGNQVYLNITNSDSQILYQY